MHTLQKAYLEITNRCNLSCSFCPKTRRRLGFLSPEDFGILPSRLRPHTQYLYLHLMGEPLLHPQLDELLSIAQELDFFVMITTNGTLLPQRGKLLLDSPAVRKVSISLHSFEGDGQGIDLEGYLEACFRFAARLAQREGKRCALRLWNLDGDALPGMNRLNQLILSRLEETFPPPWTRRWQGTTLAPDLYLEWGERFQWPDLAAPEGAADSFCRGLRNQVGVLWNGTVVPCCLDHEGDIPLGSLYRQSLEDILQSPRARSIYEGFSQHQAREPLCLRCGFRRREG